MLGEKEHLATTKFIYFLFVFSLTNVLVVLTCNFCSLCETKVSSITSLVMPSLWKICGNCHEANIIISLTNNLGFFHASIAISDELAMLTIKGKWLETIMHML